MMFSCMSLFCVVLFLLLLCVCVCVCVQTKQAISWPQTQSKQENAVKPRAEYHSLESSSLLSLLSPSSSSTLRLAYTCTKASAIDLEPSVLAPATPAWLEKTSCAIPTPSEVNLVLAMFLKLRRHCSLTYLFSQNDIYLAY